MTWPLPLEAPSSDVCMVWHRGSDDDDAQRWLRVKVLELFRADESGDRADRPPPVPARRRAAFAR